MQIRGKEFAILKNEQFNGALTLLSWVLDANQLSYDFVGICILLHEDKILKNNWY